METVLLVRGHNIFDYKPNCYNYCVYCKYNVINVHLRPYRTMRTHCQANRILYSAYDVIIVRKIGKKQNGLGSKIVLTTNVHMNITSTELYRID